MGAFPSGMYVGRAGRGPGGGEWRVKGGNSGVAGLPACMVHLCAANNNDSITIVFFTVPYGGDVWRWRAGVLGVVRGGW